MIPIQRTDCPSTLKGRGAQGDHYNKQKVVSALWQMQLEKCCYCERKLPETGHLKAVDHFAPKSIFKGLRNEWTNLLLACSQCNGKKSNKFPVMLSDEENEPKVVYLGEEAAGETAIIDPSSVDPEEHIDFEFTGGDWTYGLIKARCGSVLGEETISVVGLHEQYYTKLHYSYYVTVVMGAYRNLLQAKVSQNEALLDIEKRSFEGLMAPHNEFAGFIRAFVRYEGLNGDPFNLEIPGNATNGNSVGR